jgi:hypothetical protein
VQSKCEGCEQLVRTLNSTRRELELMQHNAAESEMLLRKLGDFEAESVLRGAGESPASGHNAAPPRRLGQPPKPWGGVHGARFPLKDHTLSTADGVGLRAWQSWTQHGGTCDGWRRT